MKRLLLTLSLLLCAVQAYAQQARSGYTGFALTSPLEVSGGQDSNFLIDRTSTLEKLFFLSLSPTVQQQTPLAQPKAFDDQVLLVNAPTLSYLADTQRLELAVNYRPEFELFRQNSDQNAWNHDFSAGFAYLLNRRTEIFVGDMFRATQDPSRTVQSVSLLLPRNQYSENAFRASLTQSLSALTRFELRFDDTVTKYGQDDPFQVRLLDTRTTGGAVVFTHMVKRNQRFRGTYAMFRARPVDQQDEGDSVVDVERVGLREPTHTVIGAYQFGLNATTIVEGSGGLANGDGLNSYVWSVSADKLIGEMVIGGAYGRTLLFYGNDPTVLATGLRSNDVYEVASFRIRGRLKPRMDLLLNVTAARDVSENVFKRTRSLLARLRLDYQWTDRTATFLNLETYQQSRNDFVNDALARNRMFVGIEYSLTSDTRRPVTNFGREPEYIGLPGRGRRR